MDERVERRGPDRHLFVLRLLRRLAALALVLAAALWMVPRALLEFGVVGPTAQERIDEAARAIAAARAYGGGTAIPALRQAEEGIASARALAGQGREREARREAVRATRAAIEAQKMALVADTAVRQRADAIYADLESGINDLEKLYGQAATGLPRQETARLLTVMKVTRQATGAVFLAYEQENFRAVVDGEPRAREAVESARRALEAARPR